MGRYSRDPNYDKPPRWDRVYDRHCPEDTDPYSRHVKMISKNLRSINSEVRRMLIDAGYEPDHWAHSMEVVVQQMWKEREAVRKNAN